MERTFNLLALCSAMAIGLPAQDFTSLFSFDWTDGDAPFAALVQADDGGLYGATEYGGSHNGGTIFAVAPAGTLKTIYSFCSQANCADGRNPQAGLVQAIDGALYGTTGSGGAYYSGTVFRFAPGGALTTLYSFCPLGSPCTDGGGPLGLVQAAGGEFYGTTNGGGANLAGTVFKITPSGKLTTLYTFCSEGPACADGATPWAGLIEAEDGNFYGTTSAGGAYGGGTVFQITPAGTLTTLYSFCSEPQCADGDSPLAGLVQTSTGDFYGTAGRGGANGDGTVFKMPPGGAVTTLYSFCSQTGCTDGSGPHALTLGSDGYIYGTTSGNGTNGGTIYKLNSEGVPETLLSFCNQLDGPRQMTDACAKGQSPYAAMVEATNGEFYGTTVLGGYLDGGCYDFEGPSGCGTVFRLVTGLSPLVEAIPASGTAGGAVKILGSNLTGASGVTFHGVAAAFTVVSPTEITTTVPAGATSGPIQVATPGGTLSSNARFVVR
jgi:uncharacterized repeat protein (TIGR03803 family)